MEGIIREFRRSRRAKVALAGAILVGAIEIQALRGGASLMALVVIPIVLTPLYALTAVVTAYAIDRSRT